MLVPHAAELLCWCILFNLLAVDSSKCTYDVRYKYDFDLTSADVQILALEKGVKPVDCFTLCCERGKFLCLIMCYLYIQRHRPEIASHMQSLHFGLQHASNSNKNFCSF